MQALEIAATRIFYDNYNSVARVVCNRGGARSSKSYSLTQLILMKFLSERRKKFLVVRKSLPSLRISTLPTFMDLIEEWKVSHKIHIEKQYLNFNGVDTKNFLHFGSIDDPEKIKSSEWNYIFMEEATEFTYEDFITLKIRTSAKSLDGKPNQMFLSFNPVDEYHWTKTKVIDNPAEDVLEIISTYKDNPYLDKDYIKMLEDLAVQDPNFYRVYCQGDWGRLDQLIYSNWTITRDFPSDHQIVYGIDFGFAQAPTAVLKTNIKYDTQPEVWAQQLLYKTGLTNADLIKILPTIIPNKMAWIFADNAEPDRILEIKRAGYLNIRPAQKDVQDGIDFVKRFRMYFHEDSTELIKEARTYSWKSDRAGNVIGEPVKYQDHLLDCLRYALYSWYRNRQHVRLRWI